MLDDLTPEKETIFALKRSRLSILSHRVNLRPAMATRDTVSKERKTKGKGIRGKRKKVKTEEGMGEETSFMMLLMQF